MSEDLFNPLTISSVVGNVVLTGWHIVRHIRLRSSSDNLQINRNAYEDSLLKALQEQSRLDRERADRAEHERNQAIVEVGQLKGQVQAFSLQLQAVKQDLEAAHLELQASRTEIRSLRETLQQLIDRRIH